MKEKTRQERIIAVLQDMAELYEKTLTPKKCRLIIDALEGYSVERIVRACKQCMRKFKFFPTPAEILECIFEDYDSYSEPIKTKVVKRGDMKSCKKDIVQILMKRDMSDIGLNTWEEYKAWIENWESDGEEYICPKLTDEQHTVAKKRGWYP